MSLSDIRPLRSSKVAQQLGDQAGGVAYAGGVEGDVSEIAFGGPTADFILYGVVNGAFGQGPPNPAENIDPVNNPMPYWSGPTQVSGGAITATWVASSTSPSGYVLEFTLNPGAASDEAYFEQIVPIGGERRRGFANIARVVNAEVSETGAGNAQFYVSTQYLTAAGVATGAAQTSSVDFAGAGTSNILTDVPADGQPPTDALFLRVRIGVTRAALAATGTVVSDFHDVRVDRASLVSLLADKNRADLYAPGVLVQYNGVVYLNAQYDGEIGSTTLRPYLSVNTTGVTLAQGNLVLSNTIYPTIAANQDDYAPTDLATCSRVHITVSGATRTITGFDATGFTDGQEFSLLALTNDIVLADASGSSASGNRIKTPASAGLTVREGGGVRIVYDTGSSAANPFRVLTP